jgi:hypothetical protein
LNRTVVLRTGGLVVAALGVVAALTVYFSTQRVPPCLVTGVPRWKPPTDGQVHHFELVVPDRALCFFDMDANHAPAGYVKLGPVVGVDAIAPRPGGKLALRYGGGRGALVDLRTGRVTVGATPPPAPSGRVSIHDESTGVDFTTQPGELGFRVVAAAGPPGRLVTFPGFGNTSFGARPPDHGLALAPDRPELFVLDAPNGEVHVFDVAGVPGRTPRDVSDIRLTSPISGDESPCASDSCARLGSLQASADGRFVYVGDAGDVIDTARREEVVNLAALRQSRLTIEVDWAGGRPEFPAAAIP